jgi:ABC-type dipeptide/oligopeptide/nickel transport system permease subunit
LWLLGAPLVVAGTTAFAAAVGTRAGLSFLIGYAIALATVSLGVLLVDVAGRLAPSLALVVALGNYALTVLFFLLLLSVVSPKLADVPAFATGLASAVVPYVAWQLARARLRP